MWKADEGEAERIVLLIFGCALIVGGCGLVGWDRKSYSGPVEIASFLRRDFSQSNKYDTFWHVVSTGYFYVLIYKDLDRPLSTTTFTVKSHVDGSINICLFQILYSMKLVFY